MSKQVLINTLREYFTSKGGFMTAEEYKEATDAPYRFQIVKRTIGTWPRLKNIIGEIKAPEPVEAPKPASKPVAKPKPAETKKSDG